MKTLSRTRVGLFCLTSLLSLALVSAHADPSQRSSGFTLFGGLFGGDAPARDNQLKMYRLDNLTLDYGNATKNSSEVLASKVSVTIKDASFLAALDTLMNASEKTCRIEVRQVRPQRLSLSVKDVPLAGMLDSLAKLGGARLYVLPSKLILAPEKALSEEEKKNAKLYGVLLTAATLPNTPEAKALLKPNAKGKTILDAANAPASGGGVDIIRSAVLCAGPLNPRFSPDQFTPRVVGPVSQSILDATMTYRLQGVTCGDAFASFARAIGCELYLTPEHFIICPPGHLNDPDVRQWTQGAVPAFTSSSISINFTDPSANAS